MPGAKGRVVSIHRAAGRTSLLGNPPSRSRIPESLTGSGAATRPLRGERRALHLVESNKYLNSQSPLEVGPQPKIGAKEEPGWAFRRGEIMPTQSRHTIWGSRDFLYTVKVVFFERNILLVHKRQLPGTSTQKGPEPLES